MILNKIKDLIKIKDYDGILSLYFENQRALSINGEVLYYVGLAIESNNDMYLEENGSFEYYLKSASYGYNPAKYRLAEYYFYLYKEYYEEEDLDSFRNYIIDCAENGYDLAQYVLAEMYFDGRYINEDHSLAKLYYKLSASSGCAPALYKMATFYEEGILFNQDLDLALEFYNKAAEKNCDLAFQKLGQEYLFGYLVNFDYSKAFYYFKKYIEIVEKEDKLDFYKLFFEDDKTINDTARYLLGYMYERGLGGEQNIDKAIDLYNSIRHTYSPGEYRLLIMSSNSINSNKNEIYERLVSLINQDFFELIDEFDDNEKKFYIDNSKISNEFLDQLYYNYQPLNNKAKYNLYRLLFVSNKRLLSSYKLGKLFSSGYPYRDIKKAIQYFEIGVKNGCMNSAYWLGKHYQKKNSELAFNYIKMAAAPSDSKAKYEYGYMLYYGIGCGKNETLALEQLKKAMSLGCRRSKVLINKIK